MADDEVSLETSPAYQERTSDEASGSPPTPGPDSATAVGSRDSIENEVKDERRETIDKKEITEDEEIEKKEEPTTMEAAKNVVTSTKDETTSAKLKEDITTASEEDVPKEESVEPVVNGKTSENEAEEEEKDVDFKSHRRQRGTGSSSEEEEEGEVEQQQQQQGEGDHRTEEGEVTEEEEEVSDDDGWEEEGGEKKSPAGTRADGSGAEQESNAGEEEEEISKKDPMYVPRGRYFHHDDREHSDDEQAAVVEVSKAPSRSEIVDKWEHDLYVESEQVPRTPEEKRRDQMFYNSRRGSKDQQGYEGSGGDNRRGVPLRQFFPPERRERGHQSNRDRRKVSGERDEGIRSGQNRTEYNDRPRNENGDRRSEYRGDRQQQRGGYKDGRHHSSRQQRDYNEMVKTNIYRIEKWDEVDRAKSHREDSRQEEADHKEQVIETTSEQDSRVSEGQKDETDESRGSESSKLAVVESAKKRSPSPQKKHSEKSPSPTKNSPKSLFQQNSAAPMPSRVFTLGKHSDLIVRDVSSKSAAGARRAVGRGRGRGRGMITARQQTTPGGTKVIAPFSAASSTTPAAVVIESSTYTLKTDERSASPADLDAAVTDSPTKEPTSKPEPLSTPPETKGSPSQPAKTTSILGSPPLESKPKRYSSRRQKGGGAVPLTATPTNNYTDNVGEEGLQSAAPSAGNTTMPLPPPGSMPPWAQPVPLDPVMFQQQQAMWAAFMQQMMYQQQHMMMSGAYPPPGVAPSPAGPPPPPMMEQYIEPATAQQLAAYTPPPPGSRVYVPSMESNDQRQIKRSTNSLQQKPNQAIPIVSPDEK